MIQNLLWATGYNVVALPLSGRALCGWGVLLTPALGAVFMSASTVTINARLLRLKTGPKPQGKAGPKANARSQGRAQA